MKMSSETSAPNGRICMEIFVDIQRDDVRESALLISLLQSYTPTVGCCVVSFGLDADQYRPIPFAGISFLSLAHDLLPPLVGGQRKNQFAGTMILVQRGSGCG